MKNKTTKIMILTVAILLIVSVTACKTEDKATEEKPYSEALEERLAKEMSNETRTESRPGYLPGAMFSRLPEFPNDFYRVRALVGLGRIKDIENLGPEYWMQPEFFPHFEDIGLPLLQNPPIDRWGAYGIAVYPADSVSTIVAGESLDMYFFIKSNYLVETYQGINLEVKFPDSARIESGFEMPDGSKNIKQDGEGIEKYFDVEVDSNLFILEPNFPIYNINGTRKIKMTVTVSEDTPPGNYVVTLDTGGVPEEYEQKWIKKYLNLYTGGGMTKIDRPYYQAFIRVKGGEEE